MAVAAMTIAGGGCAQRALRGICTGTAQGWTVGCVRVVHRSLATTSPGLCLQGCVAQGAPCKGVRRRAARKVRSGWSVRRQRRSAPCAWRAAVVLPRIRAQPRAEMMGGKLLGSAAQPGAGCGVRCTRSPATGAGCVGAVCEGAVCAADAISAAPPWCSVVVGSAPREAMMTPRSRPTGAAINFGLLPAGGY